MAYHMYTTEALVCGSLTRNGADCSYLLFTDTLGMVYATARSVREERSRQRQALQDFSLIRVSLVNGKSGWRIGSVESQQNVFLAAPTRLERAHIVRLVRLVRRYVQGEAGGPDVFTSLTAALTAFAAGSVEYPDAFADAVTFRILYQLGYVAPAPAEQYLITAPVGALDMARDAASIATVRRAVAAAATASQL